MKKRLKINGVIIFFALLLCAFFPTVFFRNERRVLFDEAAEIFGIAFILLGQILRASARGYKAENSKNGHSLIQGGPYTLVRNPMYLGILLIGFGIVWMLLKWWAIVIFLVVFITRYVLLILKEEKKLSAMFPKEYQEYKQMVPRILPSLAAISQRDVSEYMPLKLGWLKGEIGSIFAVLFVTLLIESWEDIKNEGIRAYLHEAMLILMIVFLFVGLVVYLSKQTQEADKGCFK
jgi:protein-S-isoprenylcysteine O-methyltransferase Ste14